MEKLKTCPICNSPKINYRHNCKDYVASGELFGIFYCNNCTHQFTNPRPIEKRIGKYYQSDRYVSHSGDDKGRMGLTYKIYDIVRNINIKSKLRLIKKYHKSGKLLDLGCGLGYFLNGVITDGTFSATGVDVSDEALAYVKKKFNIIGFDETYLDKFEPNMFDVITLWHVLEHVYDLKARLKQLKRILKPNGTMFIAVPNSASWDAKHYKKYWDGYDVPRHIHHFSRESFVKLFEENGFKIEKIKGMLFDAPYISMRSEFHQNNSFAFIRGAIKGVISTISALKTGQHSSLLFVIKNK
jgi:2-polyprenyl-3-methyl-5-hydroxy-6-metoxy-1,4-benzoquinol methylase